MILTLNIIRFLIVHLLLRLTRFGLVIGHMELVILTKNAEGLTLMVLQEVGIGFRHVDDWLEVVEFFLGVVGGVLHSIAWVMVHCTLTVLFTFLRE